MFKYSFKEGNIMKMNPRYVKVFFLYLVSAFISNRLTTNKSLCKTLMQGILGYGLFALGLKYLTIKKKQHQAQ